MILWEGERGAYELWVDRNLLMGIFHSPSDDGVSSFSERHSEVFHVVDLYGLVIGWLVHPHELKRGGQCPVLCEDGTP